MQVMVIYNGHSTDCHRLSALEGAFKILYSAVLICNVMAPFCSVERFSVGNKQRGRSKSILHVASSAIVFSLIFLIFFFLLVVPHLVSLSATYGYSHYGYLSITNAGAA